MINKKGQAFDAFKLLIAAVVAGSILVILLNIIGGITLTTQEPVQVMGQEMSSVSAGGICSISTNVVEFTRGTTIQSDAVAVKAGMNEGSVKFCCSSDVGVGDDCNGYEFSEEDEAFNCEEDNLGIDEDIHGNIRACCPTTQGDPCVIGFRMAR